MSEKSLIWACSIAGVANIRPAGQNWPAGGYNATFLMKVESGKKKSPNMLMMFCRILHYFKYIFNIYMNIYIYTYIENKRENMDFVWTSSLTAPSPTLLGPTSSPNLPLN